MSSKEHKKRKEKEELLQSNIEKSKEKLALKALFLTKV